MSHSQYHSPFYPTWTPDDLLNVSPTRALARSLLAEALAQPLPAPVGWRRGEPRRRLGRIATWTRAEQLDALREFVARCGHLPTATDWLHAATIGLPARQTVVRHFGTMAACVAALREASMPEDNEERAHHGRTP